MLTELSLNNSHCKLSSIDWLINLFNNIWKSTNMVFMSVSYNKTFNLINVILKELRAIGIRPNEQPPDVTVKRKKLGGVKVSSTCKLTHMDEKTIRSILN